MRSALAGSLTLHAVAIGALFVTHPATTVVLPGPDVVQVSLVDAPSPMPAPAAAPKAPPPAPPAPKPDADRGVRIEP
ncbi:MAG TPA: serine/threonine protein kinase, partial [Candidatus Eisenbacteria bacterium]|nr:serine/threonine protein kinase [Candidatus Eisenbacteria bacterium]